MKETKYNYIIAGVDRYYSIVYKDLQNKPNIKCYKSYIDGIKSKFIQFLVRVDFNIRLNKYIIKMISLVLNHSITFYY